MWEVEELKCLLGFCFTVYDMSKISLTYNQNYASATFGAENSKRQWLQLTFFPRFLRVKVCLEICHSCLYYSLTCKRRENPYVEMVRCRTCCIEQLVLWSSKQFLKMNSTQTRDYKLQLFFIEALLRLQENIFGRMFGSQRENKNYISVYGKVKGKQEKIVRNIFQLF